MFYLRLTGATNADLADSEAQCRILNDDPLPCLSIDPVSMAEAVEARARPIPRLALQPSCSNVTVHFSTFDSTAIAGQDYVATNGSVTFLGLGTNRTVPPPPRTRTSQ